MALAEPGAATALAGSRRPRGGTGIGFPFEHRSPDVKGEELTMDVVAKLKYVHGVVSETLRMLPPATRIERLALENYVLGDTGIKVPKGFIGENIESIRPYTYLPFGAGPRNCIGNRFALEVIKIALLHVVRSVEFYRSQNTPEVLIEESWIGFTFTLRWKEQKTEMVIP
ncbi:hypothetical protein HPB47_016192 [Ixodes persulcatus]|uniref:Uncharacterized protein n=1 Tax=Ixodes persulcatus TaxID=34615 RepID=A0AC60QRH8_IXOPE|nr:hypothetical protein HPB47_016192 [Ixodes persulcatus]